MKSRPDDLRCGLPCFELLAWRPQPIHRAEPDENMRVPQNTRQALKQFRSVVGNRNTSRLVVLGSFDRQLPTTEIDVLPLQLQAFCHSQPRFGQDADVRSDHRINLQRLFHDQSSFGWLHYIKHLLIHWKPSVALHWISQHQSFSPCECEHVAEHSQTAINGCGRYFLRSFLFEVLSVR